MPIVRVDLMQGKSPDYRRAIGEIVYEAMTTTINVPKEDRFIIVTEHVSSDLNFSDSYLGVTRTENIVFIQVTLNAGRTTALKQAFYKAVADGLHARLGLRREDVFISLLEVVKESWSFGNGVAQYADKV